MGRMSTIAGRLALTGTIAGLCLWLTMNRARSAQDAKPDATPVPAHEEPGQLKPAERKDVSPAPTTVDPSPAALAPAPATAISAPDAVPLPQESELTVPVLNKAVSTPVHVLNPTDSQPPVPQPSRGVLGTDDPEKDAQAFAEQNRKQAEAQLKTLKDEGARLRARLQKVDSGIKRWEALLEALKQSESVSSGEPGRRTSAGEPWRPRDPAPGELEDAPPRVKSRPATRSDRPVRRVPPADEPPGLLEEDTPKPH